MNLSSYIRTAKSVITANSPVLLLGATIAGVVTTGVLSAKAGWNARGVVDDEVLRRTELVNMNEFPTFEEYKVVRDDAGALTTQEIIQLTWNEYTFAAISAAGTIASAVGTHVIHTKRANAMAVLYAATTNKLDDMTQRAEELLGPKKTQQLRDDVAQKEIDRGADAPDSSEVMILDEGTELCYDGTSGRWFMSSMPKLEMAINDLNRMIVHQGDASLNDFYEFLGLDDIPIGSNIGWSGVKVEPRFGGVTSKDGRPAISINFHTAPKEN